MVRFLFNLTCTLSLILGLGAVGTWVRSYYAADQLTLRRPFEPGGQRVAAQAKSERGSVTVFYGTERVRPQDLPKLQWDAWTKPGMIHVQKPLAAPLGAQPVAAMAEGQGPARFPTAQAQPAQTQPAQTQPAEAKAATTAPSAATSDELIARLKKFDHKADPRTGVVQVGKHKVSVATDRTVTVFPHWALAGGLFLLPMLRYTFRRPSGTRAEDIRRRFENSNSYDTWATQTPPERRRKMPLSGTY